MRMVFKKIRRLRVDALDVGGRAGTYVRYPWYGMDATSWYRYQVPSTAAGSWHGTSGSDWSMGSNYSIRKNPITTVDR